MSSGYINIPVSGGGPGAGVASVNSATGALTLVAGTGIDVSTVGQTITVSANPPVGSFNTFTGYDGTGALYSIPGMNIDTTSGGINQGITIQPNDEAGGFTLDSYRLSFEPLQDSPNVSWNLSTKTVEFDINDSGFDQGTSGTAVNVNSATIRAEGTGNVGQVAFHNNYMALGNGTDPITVSSAAYSYGFADIRDGLTMTGQLQGYGFQPQIAASAALLQGIRPFYDNTNAPNTTVNGYAGFDTSPNIGTIPNNNGVTAFAAGGNITAFEGNAGYTGLGIFPSIDSFETGSFQGVSISPTIDLNPGYSVGLNVNMDNVTNFPGVAASLVVQDITYTLIQPGTEGNNISVEYLNTTTAGNEVASLVGGTQIQVTIESGVSTATQVRAALLANVTLVSNITFPITGTGSNPQVTFAQTNLAGGVAAGTKKAAQFNGDVQIDGALSFSGGLSIGALSSFANVDISAYPGGVNSIDTLITAPQVVDNTTLNTDVLAVNTAMLMTVGDNCTLTSSFLGYVALGLPAVISMGTGSTIDRVAGATFAISLDAGATGGTIDEVDLCRAVAIPNGATTINKLYGYKMDLPFGDPGTTTFGTYITPAAHNYMAGDLLIGGTPGSDDTVANANVALQIKSTTKAFVLSTITTTERDAMTPVQGMVIFNTTTLAMEVYNGSAWV